jgi:hypothetical protein
VVVAKSMDGVNFQPVAEVTLADRGQEDRMITRFATSADGLDWHDHGIALRGTPGRWDARGARITAILADDPLTVLYDGRASASENWFERTGLAREQDGSLIAVGDTPIAESSDSDCSSAISVPFRSREVAPGSTLRLRARTAHTI